MVSTRNPRMWSMARKLMWGEVYGASGRWSMATQPPFLSKIAMNDHFQGHWRLTPTNFWPTNGLHEKSKIVIYGKKTFVGWSVQASGRWSMATQPPFLSEIAMNDHFQWHWRLTKNMIYGKETYIWWGVRASGRRSMATQPPFVSKIAMNGHFQ
jgi:hypothetical protein